MSAVVAQGRKEENKILQLRGGGLCWRHALSQSEQARAQRELDGAVRDRVTGLYLGNSPSVGLGRLGSILATAATRPDFIISHIFL